MTIWGTCHFTSEAAAIRYYRDYCDTRATAKALVAGKSVQAIASDEAVHIDFWPTPDAEEQANRARFRLSLGYLAISPDQARKLSAELLAAADKADRYES
jgi:hypothetical protein